MFKTLRKEFKELFEAFISSGNSYVIERDKRVIENYKKEIEVLKKYHDELEELKIFKSDMSRIIHGLSGTTVSVCNWDDIKIKGQTNCYFTRELISEDATNTKILYIVNGEQSKKVFFKEGNQTKDVEEINGKLYLFN